MRPGRRLKLSRTMTAGLLLAASLTVGTLTSPAGAETATRPSGMHFQPQMGQSFGSGIVPPLGPTIVPPLGTNMVPPLVSEGSRDGFNRIRPGRFPFFPFIGGVYLSQPPSPAAVPAPQVSAPDLPPPPPDFEPRLVSLKPFARQPGDPASVTVLRAGEPGEVVKFAGATH